MPKESITLAKALTLYYTEHGRKVASHKAAKTHCEKILSYWKDSVLSEMSIREQRKFKDFLEGQGCSIGYIKRIFNTLRAAVNFCYKNEYIEYPVNMLTISVPLHSNVEMGRPLGIEEVAKLFDVMDVDYLIRYCMLLIGTLGRPAAILELHSSQLDHGYKLIQLNPPGRQQTTKFRPTVKMPEFIHVATRHMKQCNVVTGKKEELKSLKSSFTTAVKYSGLEGKVTGYSFRHTMSRWLRSQSVPPWEVAAQLGHRMEQYSTTEVYAPYDPNYLTACVVAIDRYFEKLRDTSVTLDNFMKLYEGIST
ncbi:tyrosine-type recombinase/integrase [Spartinivicinus ruber]|uniref:tyrosine-type recombinase/integrase n=1 Tax=Spartinivicinus ruber TaxID=2683272 RepID=UPI0013D771D4|nr:tyrosine-type recombinase/integrase [Spartinivicinus ruber]